MILFRNNKGVLETVKEKPFRLEKDIQSVFEQNISLISNLAFVKSEFSIKSNRIDTLAFDNEAKSFVIIEYKKDKNFSVIDQGVSYLNLMLEYKSDFIVEYNETLKSTLKRAEVDWSQSKVIFVSPYFTDFQKQSTNFKDLSIELWEIKQYENEIIVVNPVQKSKSAPSIKQVQTNQKSEINKVTNEIVTYDEDYHLESKSDEIKELYEKIKQSILNIRGDISFKAYKTWINFNLNNNILGSIEIQQKSVLIYLNLKKGQLNDLRSIARDVSSIGHYGIGDYQIRLVDDENLEYIMSLVKQNIPRS